MVWVDQRYGGGHKNSEDFNTCGRTIKTGLIAVGEHNAVHCSLAAGTLTSCTFAEHELLACRYCEPLDMGRYATPFRV